jgi:hypothetical protein
MISDTDLLAMVSPLCEEKIRGVKGKERGNEKEVTDNM